MKRIIQIVLLFLLFSGTAFGQEKSDCIMNISVWDKSPKQNIILTITSPEGKKVWNADSKSNKVLDINTNFIEITANKWYSLPGNYNINIELTDKDSENKKNSSLDFAMNGNEINLKTIIYLPRSAEHSTLSNVFFNIKKSNYSSDSIKLIERWKPTANSKAEYTIVNNSSEKIIGTSWLRNYFGEIMKYVDGKWSIYNRGGFCGTVVSGDKVLPRDSTTSVEGDFIGEPKIFTPGRYKYYVYYTHSDYDFDLFRSRAQNNVVDIYLLEKEFTIE